MQNEEQVLIARQPWSGRGWLCLLLAITFLYNPFLAASSWSGQQSIGHLPSFRATVASSELLRFKPKEKLEAPSAPDIEVARLPIVSAPEPTAIRRTVGAPESTASQFFHESNLWFRPPPVVS